MELADAHNHLDAPELDEDPDGIVARGRAAGVARLFLAGTRPGTWARTARVAAEVGGAFALGVHPWWADELDEAALDALRAAEADAIGEIGLDRLRGPAHEVQEAALRAQLAVARERELPVVLHCVRAYGSLLDLLEADGLPARGGLVHGWSGSPEVAERAVALGLMISFSPLVCGERATKARASVPRVPLDRLLVETDAHGEPAALLDVVRVAAALRGEAPEEVAAATARNLDRLLQTGTA